MPQCKKVLLNLHVRQRGVQMYGTKMSEPTVTENINAFLNELDQFEAREAHEAVVHPEQLLAMVDDVNEFNQLAVGSDDEESEAVIDDFNARYAAWSTKFWELKRKFGWKSLVASGIFLKGMQRYVLENPETERNLLICNGKRCSLGGTSRAYCHDNKCAVCDNTSLADDDKQGCHPIKN